MFVHCYEMFTLKKSSNPGYARKIYAYDMKKIGKVIFCRKSNLKKTRDSVDNRDFSFFSFTYTISVQVRHTYGPRLGICNIYGQYFRFSWRYRSPYQFNMSAIKNWIKLYPDLATALVKSYGYGFGTSEPSFYIALDASRPSDEHGLVLAEWIVLFSCIRVRELFTYFDSINTRCIIVQIRRWFVN